MRFFNVAGPCFEHYHYMLPAAERLPEAPKLISQGAYFVLHAPRQTGKTTTLRALAKQVTEAGEYAALYFSCESGDFSDEDFVGAQRSILRSIQKNAAANLPEELQPPQVWEEKEDHHILSDGFSQWARHCPRRLVLLFDEIDSLKGKSLLTVLRQLRANYHLRPEAAPWAVILCGLRDVRDYKMASGGNPERLNTSSPFNIKTKSVRLGSFDTEEIATLYGQHTEETGQPFTQDAIDKAFELTAGQPWLVNALAKEVIDEMEVAGTIEGAHISKAGERLILARATHLDSLVARLHEDHVRRVIEPLMAGTFEGGDCYDDDFQYVYDLGLIAEKAPTKPANPIYREVMMRVLASGLERRMDPPSNRSFILEDGKLDIKRILEEFSAFWMEHGDILTNGITYHEVAPQLVLMAYLQRVVNGGGYVEREYGAGRGRIDVLVRWPDKEGVTNIGAWQKEGIELKVWAEGKPDPLDKGLTQIEGYLEGLGLDSGYLVIFDRRPDAKSIPERTAFEMHQTASGKRITLLRA